ncbi:MAG TPA: hypothetical protein VEH82_10470 [Acidimicrobiales bacterium]|nr:hypothetical protein [Acidimicrobiales bacterium]
MAATALDTERPTAPTPRSKNRDPDRRRFTRAAVGGTLVAAVPFLWILTDLWSGHIQNRRVAPFNFYDLQAEAMIHGHLWVQKKPLGIEAFIHDGRAFTYFGLFPSILRIPLLLVAPGTSGHLTLVSIFGGWLLTALFTSLLLWRVRVLLRAPAALGVTEAVTYGVLIATVLGGSLFLYLAALPWVYHEDLVWSVGLTVGTVFVLLGILQRPSRGRVLAAGALMLAGNLDRLPTAWGCVFGAVLVAGWFALGRGGVENKRWALPVLAAGLVPLAVGCAVNMAKFGVPFGFNFADQVWTQVNAHRRTFLRANGGRGWSLAFLPTTLRTYLSPFGIRFQSVFPFITIPASSPVAVGNVVFDRLYRTPSIVPANPLLCLLSIWAVIATFRRRASTGAKLLRIPLAAAASGAAVVLVWGYIAPRFEMDFMPFLVVGGVVGLVDLWNHRPPMGRRARRLTVTGVIVLGLFSFVANFGIAAAPTIQWVSTQAAGYVTMVKDVSDLTGHPLSQQVKRGPTLPYWAPANELFIVGDCAGLYISDGEDFRTVQSQQLEHATWVPVERGSAVLHTLRVTFDAPVSDMTSTVRLLRLGGDTILIQRAGTDQVRIVLHDPHFSTIGALLRPTVGTPYRVAIESDPMTHVLQVSFGDQARVLTAVLFDPGPATGPVTLYTQPSTSEGDAAPITVVDTTHARPDLSICLSLLHAT